MSRHYTIVNNNYIIVNNIFNDCIINLCGFRFFWDTLYYTEEAHGTERMLTAICIYVMTIL